MSLQLSILVGLLVLMALSRLLIGLADLVGLTETRHLCRTTHVDTEVDTVDQILRAR